MPFESGLREYGKDWPSRSPRAEHLPRAGRGIGSDPAQRRPRPVQSGADQAQQHQIRKRSQEIPVAVAVTTMIASARTVREVFGDLGRVKFAL